MLNKLEKKLKEIRAGKEMAQAQLNAFVGAEQTILQLIDEVSNEPKAQEAISDENIQN